MGTKLDLIKGRCHRQLGGLRVWPQIWDIEEKVVDNSSIIVCVVTCKMHKILRYWIHLMMQVFVPVYDCLVPMFVL